jgi:hypothetical protein
VSEPKDFPQDMRIETPAGVWILIPFTHFEWDLIAELLRYDTRENTDNLFEPILEAELSILDRIEKNLRTK